MRRAAAAALAAAAWCALAALGACVPVEDAPVAQKGNPFVDELLRPPAYTPAPAAKPWNLYEIPELPDRFEMFFKYDHRTEGRWVYDYRNRRTLVEYFVGGRGARGKHGLYGDYRVLSEKLLEYDTAGSPGGEQCSYYDLVRPYERMWSPRTWRKMDVFSIDFGGISPLESERLRTSVAVSGTFDNYMLQFSCYTNGTARRISIGKHHWEVTGFTDLSNLDREAWEATAAFRDLHTPEMECTYAGGVNTEYSEKLQSQLPWMLYKPTQNPGIRELAKHIRALEREGHPQAAEAFARKPMKPEELAGFRQSTAEGVPPGESSAPGG